MSLTGLTFPRFEAEFNLKEKYNILYYILSFSHLSVCHLYSPFSLSLFSSLPDGKGLVSFHCTVCPCQSKTKFVHLTINYANLITQKHNKSLLNAFGNQPDMMCMLRHALIPVLTLSLLTGGL